MLGHELSIRLTLYRLAIQVSQDVIDSFLCKDTAQLWLTGRNKRFAMIASVALRKLAMLDAADVIDDLRVPPGTRLEALKGERSGQHSIRINAQWRLCFRWQDGTAFDVEITDYH
jgi:proteic killer suppression protein